MANGISDIAYRDLIAESFEEAKVEMSQNGYYPAHPKQRRAQAIKAVFNKLHPKIVGLYRTAQKEVDELQTAVAKQAADNAKAHDQKSQVIKQLAGACADAPEANRESMLRRLDRV